VNKSSKKQHKKKRRPVRRGVKVALITIFALATLALAAFLGYYVFQITEIRIEGNDTFTNEQILAYVDAEIGQNIFTVDTDAIHKELSTFPYVEVRSVRRAYPSTLIIEIKERNLKLAVKYADTYVLMDQEGTAVELAPSPQGLVEIKGVSVQAAAIGAKVQGLDDYDYYLIDQVLEHFEDSAIGDVMTSIDLSVPTMITIGVKNGLSIRIGNGDNMDQKRAWIDTLYPGLWKRANALVHWMHRASTVPAIYRNNRVNCILDIGRSKQWLQRS